MRKLFSLIVMMVSMTTSYAQKQLVLYFSETGTTKTVAQELQKQLGADIEEIEAVVPYSGNFQETIQRGQREMQNGEMPAIKPLKKKMADYEVADQDPTTPQAIKDRHNQELQDDYMKIQNFQQTASQDLQRQQETLLAPITQKIQNAIQAVGAEGGYTFIFDQAAGAIIYTGTNAEDVSAQVKAKLGIK